LTLANRWSIPIYTIDETNIDEILPQLDTFDIVKQNIVDAINMGWTAVVPQTNIQLNQWYGAGWIIMDPDTGSAGYLLAGYLVSGSEVIMGGGSGTKQADIEDFIEKGVKALAIASLLEGLGCVVEAGVVFAATGASIISGAITAASVLGGLAMVGLGAGMVIGAVVVGIWLVHKILTACNFYYRTWYAFIRTATTLS